MIRYRTSTPAEAEALAELGRRSFAETFGHLYRPEDLTAFLENHSPEKWRAELSDPALSIQVAEEDGQLIAYAKVGPATLPVPPRGAQPMELKQFYVLQPWHGSGVAGPLMDWVLAEARARGGDEIYLSVFSENHRARRFYERYGFAFVQINAFMVGEQADEDHILRLDLVA